jgi:hypothetical protein
VRASLRILVVKAQELTLKLWKNSLAAVGTTSSGGVFHFSSSFVSFDLLVEAHRRSRRVGFSLSAARYNKLVGIPAYFLSVALARNLLSRKFENKYRAVTRWRCFDKPRSRFNLSAARQ